MSNIALDGVVGPYTGDDFAIKVIFTTFLSIALYNSVELMVLIFIIFQHYRSLYFWSLLLSTVLGVIPQSLSFILKYYNFAPLWFSITLSTVGWYFMVTGQALVLYSRLNIVVPNLRVRHRVLGMIIADTILLHIPTTVLTYGSNFVGATIWIQGYKVMERIELTGFCLQEFIISGLYIHETIKILRIRHPTGQGSHPDRKIMHQLLSINFLIIMLDIILLTLEYLNYFVIQTTLKPLVYSVKLKLEFGVLNRLVSLVQSHRYRPSESEQRHATTANWLHYPELVDVSELPSTTPMRCDFPASSPRRGSILSVKHAG